VPPKRFRNLSVRQEVFEELERLRQELGFSNYSDLLILLVRTYREHTSAVSKILEELGALTSAVSKCLTSATSKEPGGEPPATGFANRRASIHREFGW
jgi:metal-responsive CopG/Arc/MetJ family transcriptional regulator